MRTVKAMLAATAAMAGLACSAVNQAAAPLAVELVSCRLTGHKMDLHLRLLNQSGTDIRSARAQFFLVGTNAQIAGHKALWLIAPHAGVVGFLPAGALTNCHVVLPRTAEASVMHLVFGQIQASDGRVLSQRPLFFNVVTP